MNEGRTGAGAAPEAPFAFERLATDGAARAGVFSTPHGAVETPTFMPVGTLATVKSLDPDDLRGAGASMILANAYHLHLRPGDDLVAEMGGLHRFMQWSAPILTDSGGFQVFSLETLRTVSEDGVEFRSHIDGSRRFFSPERVMQIERNLGADVIMQFDHVVPGQAELGAAREASERSLRWLERCKAEFERQRRELGDPHGAPQALFPIVQGGIHAELRRDAARAIRGAGDWVGYGIGGLSVGEAKPDMYAMLDVVEPELPRDRPRYLMGVGFPEDLIEGVRRGVDLFDCVAPTRMGRNGTAFTSEGRLNIKRQEWRNDPRPIDLACDCAACRRFSRAYLRHLYVSDEILGLRLLSLHNVHFLLSLMRQARLAILDHRFETWSRDRLLRLSSRATPPS
jgi:queuine tRNA-ribosyltransferase